MISVIASYLRFFDSVRRRTERDVAALPTEAAAWRPAALGGEARCAKERPSPAPSQIGARMG